MADGSATGGERPRVAVIGSGFGGLATAIRLQASGVSTVLFEARDKPGGRAYVYEDSGFVFDAGPTVITAPHVLDELFELAGRRREDYVELLPVTPFYRLIWSDGTSFDYAGAGSMEREIARFAADDLPGYARFVDYSRRVFERGYEELAAEPFSSFSDMLRVAPSLMRLRADRSVYATVASFVKNERLREALSFHSLLVGGNPFETSSIYTLIHYLERKWGVFFARGGTGALVRALVRLFQELGGELRLSAPVRSVEVERGKRVRHWLTSSTRPVQAGRQRTREAFDAVVSNADLEQTYGTLYSSEPSARRMAKKLGSAEWSMSLYVLYFGTDRPYDLAHHNVIFGPRYRELLRDVFHGSTLPDDFSLYLHAPSVTDPSLAPAGCGCFYVLSPVPHLGKASLDWETLAAPYGEKILASLERLMPNLRQHIVVRRWMTPLDFRSELFSKHGSAFSLAPLLTQSAWFRPHNRDASIPGLYLVGAGTHPGAGVPGVVSSAKATAKLVLEDLPGVST
ncbi:MAG TPA: phytoene desaturase [Polyangiaceae bacterium]|nr:phytoene desaturase [Polyangiaceae bacterium]